MLKAVSHVAAARGIRVVRGAVLCCVVLVLGGVVLYCARCCAGLLRRNVLFYSVLGVVRVSLRLPTGACAGSRSTLGGSSPEITIS